MRPILKVPVYTMRTFDVPTGPYPRFTCWTKLLIKLQCWLDTKIPKLVQPAVEVAHYHSLDLTDLWEATSDHVEQIVAAYGKYPAYLVLGADQARELMHTTLDFSEAINVELPEPFFGTKLLVIPWIDGLFCLPPIKELKGGN